MQWPVGDRVVLWAKEHVDCTTLVGALMWSTAACAAITVGSVCLSLTAFILSGLLASLVAVLAAGGVLMGVLFACMACGACTLAAGAASTWIACLAAHATASIAIQILGHLSPSLQEWLIKLLENSNPMPHVLALLGWDATCVPAPTGKTWPFAVAPAHTATSSGLPAHLSHHPTAVQAHVTPSADVPPLSGDAAPETPLSRTTPPQRKSTSAPAAPDSTPDTASALCDDLDASRTAQNATAATAAAGNVSSPTAEDKSSQDRDLDTADAASTVNTVCRQQTAQSNASDEVSVVATADADGGIKDKAHGGIKDKAHGGIKDKAPDKAGTGLEPQLKARNGARVLACCATVTPQALPQTVFNR